jgi:vanillate O-demethylase ferredoxin subunit
MDVAAICAAEPQGAHLYSCGPTPMLAAFERATVMRPKTHVHLERFASTQSPATGGFDVQLARSGRVVSIPEGSRITDALRAAGIPVVTSCEQGVWRLRDSGPAGRAGPSLRSTFAGR